MQRVLGVGGYFVRSKDPEALAAWYRDVLGLGTDDNGEWAQQSGPAVFAAMELDSTYFPAGQQTMLNLRVADLDEMLKRLRDAGVDVADETQEADGVGRFGWVTDPDGHRVELWEPPAA